MSEAITGAMVAVAAERKRLLQEEEETMSAYSREDLDGEWEFKILRSFTREFHNSQKMHEYLAEEAQHGWMLVEKFDDTRLRLKRRVKTQPDKEIVGCDPYRTSVGLSEGQMAARNLTFVGCMLGAIILMLIIVTMLK